MLFGQEVYSSPEIHMKLEDFSCVFFPVLTQDKTNQGCGGRDAPVSLCSTQAYRNLRGVVESHKNPTHNTFLLLQGKNCL